MPFSDHPERLAVVVLMRERPEALLRLLSICHSRRWAPTAVSWSTRDGLAEAALQLTATSERCSTRTLACQLRRLVDVLDVVCDHDAGLPDKIV